MDADLASMTKRLARDDDLRLDQSSGKHAVFISHYGSEMKHNFADHLYYSLRDRGVKAGLDMEEPLEGGDVRPDQSIGKHAVFISHYGTEMKLKFADHLYYSLRDRGIKAVLDMEEPLEGGDARPSILEAARTAIIQVPIFTSNYAESTGCLDELVEMMNSTKSSRSAKVIPVFYDVMREDLRNEDGPFAKAIQAHRIEGKRNKDTIQGWKHALNEASWLGGFRLETYNKQEGELLIRLLEKIEQEIDDRTEQDQSSGAHAVFISQRGMEVKRRFAHHLYCSLKYRGIKAFFDMEELPDGVDVRPFTREAARRAIIQVPIFTSTYAKSVWCLDVLVEMMESTKRTSKVIPVFYDVKSEELRKKDGPFGKAIQAHREEGKRNEVTYQGWEYALNKASCLEGFRMETYNK